MKKAIKTGVSLLALSLAVTPFAGQAQVAPSAAEAAAAAGNLAEQARWVSQAIAVFKLQLGTSRPGCDSFICPLALLLR